MQPYEPPENFSSLILSTARLVGIFNDIMCVYIHIDTYRYRYIYAYSYRYRHFDTVGRDYGNVCVYIYIYIYIGLRV